MRMQCMCVCRYVSKGYVEGVPGEGVGGVDPKEDTYDDVARVLHANKYATKPWSGLPSTALGY